MYMKLQDFFKIAPLVRKTKTKVVLLRRIGLPFLVPEIYKRKMFMLGFMITLWIWYLSSVFVWKIELQGNRSITEEDILRTLKEQNVSVGERLKTINYEEVEKYLREIYPDIIWISVKQNGTIVDITVKEKETSKIIEKEEEFPCDLLSSTEGVIKKMVVRQGVPVLPIGSFVSKGDIIVSGRIDILNDDTTVKSTRLVPSDADIWIETEKPVYISVPKVFSQKEYTGRKKTNYKIVGSKGKTVQTNFKVDFLNYDELSEWKCTNSILLWELPFQIQYREYKEYQIVEYENDFQEANQKLNHLFNEFLANLMEKGVQIISKNVRIEEGSTEWILTGNVTVLEQAYTKQQIEDLYE